MQWTVAVPFSRYLPSRSRALRHSSCGRADSLVPYCQSWLVDRKQQPKYHFIFHESLFTLAPGEECKGSAFGSVRLLVCITPKTIALIDLFFFTKEGVYTRGSGLL